MDIMTKKHANPFNPIVTGQTVRITVVLVFNFTSTISSERIHMFLNIRANFKLIGMR